MKGKYILLFAMVLSLVVPSFASAYTPTGPSIVQPPPEEKPADPTMTTQELIDVMEESYNVINQQDGVTTFYYDEDGENGTIVINELEDTFALPDKEIVPEDENAVLTPEELAELQALQPQDGPEGAARPHDPGTSWKYVGKFDGWFPLGGAGGLGLKYILNKIPGTIAKKAGNTAAWIGGATQYVDNLANVYWRTYTYKKWDTSLSPDQYMYQSTLIIYKNNKRNKVAASKTIYTYGY